MDLWIARDEDGTLCVFSVEPERDNGVWSSDDVILYPFDNNYFVELDKALFPEITWESGPVQFTLTKKES